LSTTPTGGSTASRKVPLLCSGHSRPVPDFSYSKILPDGFFIVSACLDGKPMLRNGENGDWIGTFIGHKGAVWSAHLNSNATKAVTGSADYTVKLWDAITGEDQKTFTHTRIVKSVHFSNDDKRILTGGQDKILRIFDLGKPDAEPLKLEGHGQSIKVALWCKDENLIISGAQEAGVRVWDLRTNQVVKQLATKSGVASIEYSWDGKFITVASGKEVTFYDANTFDLLKSYSVPIELNCASLAPDQSSFAVGGSSDFWVRVYDFNTSKEQEVLKGHHGPVHCVRYAPDGATFASGSEDGTIRIWQSGEMKAYGLWQDVSGKEKEPQDAKTT
jgi:serine-threonine kinase receptor-associated protein